MPLIFFILFILSSEKISPSPDNQLDENAAVYLASAIRVSTAHFVSTNYIASFLIKSLINIIIVILTYASSIINTMRTVTQPFL